MEEDIQEDQRRDGENSFKLAKNRTVNRPNSLALDDNDDDGEDAFVATQIYHDASQVQNPQFC